MPYIIYADIESLIRKPDGHENNPGNCSTTKIGEHIPCRHSMSTICGFDHTEDKHALYRGKDCIKKFCKSLKEHAKSITYFEKKKMLPLTRKELKSYIDADVCYICGIKFLKSLSKNINYGKVRDHCHYTGQYRGAAHSICNFKFKVLNEISVVFHRDSNYDYHFIIKEFASEFEGQFECIGENKGTYKPFTAPLRKKIIKNNKDSNETVISYKIKYIDSARFTPSSVSNLLDNLKEGICKIKCKGCGCFHEYKSVRDNLIIYKCLCCNKFYSKNLNEELEKKFKNKFKFSNNDINKFILLLRKRVSQIYYRCRLHAYKKNL